MRLARVPLLVVVVAAAGTAPVLAQAPAPPPGAVAGVTARTRMLVMDIQGDERVDADTLVHVRLLVAQGLSAWPDITVSVVDDVKEVVALVRDRQSLGSEDGARETAVLDAARGAGVQVLVRGKLRTEKEGGPYFLVLQRVEVADASVTGAEGRVPRLKELPAALQEILPRLMRGPPPARAAAWTLPAGKKTSFAVMDLQANGVADNLVRSLTEVLGAEIKKVENTSVVSRSDIQALLQLEATRSLAGCDQESCLAELGGALGVEKLVAGNVGRLGDSYVVSLRLISVDNVTVDNRVTTSFSGAEDQLLHAVRQAARELIGLASNALGGLSVTASRAGASVRVDGAPVGVIPVAPLRDLRPGVHAVEIEMPGYERWSGDAFVHPLETTSVWVNLQPLPPRFYQRPVFWVAVVGASTAAVVVPLAALAVAVTGGAVLLRLYTNPAPDGRGTATVTGVP